MKTYESTNAAALRKRVRKVHSKAGFAGTLYLLGALALAVLAFLPALNIGGEDLWVLTFYAPLQDALGGELNWIGLITAALYLWVLLVVVINFFRCFSKLGWLTRRSSRYVNGYNRNMRAMEDMGKRFSGSLAAIVNLSLLIYVLQPNVSDVTITNYAYITLGVGLVVHFFAGLIAGKVSWFDVQGSGGNVEEVKRECGIFVYFFRNLVQLAAIAGILYFFVPQCTIGKTIESWLGGVNPIEGDLVKNLLPVALQVLIVLFTFVLVKHATAATEFNRLGMEGKGMKNYRVFSFFVFLAAGGAFAVDYFLVQPDPITYEIVYVAAIAFGAFLVDCIFKTRAKKEAEEDYDPIDEMEKNQAKQPVYMGQAMPMQAGQPTVIYQQPPTGQPVLAYQQQPVYIPVYYPYPVQQPAPAVAPVEVKIAPTPTPAPTSAVAPTKAPDHIKPVPSPQEKAKQEALDKENAGPVEVNKPLDPNKEWKVRCPRCGKVLSVRETSPYHRCPSCDKVFALRKFQTYVKKDQ
ncbi:MAG: hypothetical protein J6B56_00300 [Clostridia bacterium]|nr:hypothetical protein [Clostridia bacterium]